MVRVLLFEEHKRLWVVLREQQVKKEHDIAVADSVKYLER